MQPFLCWTGNRKRTTKLTHQIYVLKMLLTPAVLHSGQHGHAWVVVNIGQELLSLWYWCCHDALAMMRMLMRKTMTKNIHIKNLSITLATFFHSATLTEVAFCSRKQFAMNWMFFTTWGRNQEINKCTWGNIRRRNRSQKVEEEQAGLLHLFMLDAGATAGTGLDRQFLCRIGKLHLQSFIQVLEVLWGRRSLEFQFISPSVSIALCVLLLPIDSV